MWQPLLSVWLEDEDHVKALGVQRQDVHPRRSCGTPAADPQACIQLESGVLQVSPLPLQAENRVNSRKCLVRGQGGSPRPPTDLCPLPLQCSTLCSVNSSSLLLCHSPAVPDGALPKRVFFALDNMQVDFASASGGQGFLYQPNPRLVPLSHEGPTHPYRLKPGHILDVEVGVPPVCHCLGTHHPEEVGSGSPTSSGFCYVSQGEGLNLGISKEEVRVHIGDGECLVKTLTLTHLYCEPPHLAPQPANGSGTLLQFVVSVHLSLVDQRLPYRRPMLRSPALPGADGQCAPGSGPCPVRRRAHNVHLPCGGPGGPEPGCYCADCRGAPPHAHVQVRLLPLQHMAGPRPDIYLGLWLMPGLWIQAQEQAGPERLSEGAGAVGEPGDWCG